uniref:Secreted protein n=1 Tax=Physcomitrium patens TaxID=3218 RepID=A0A2K1JYA7_PHYPA|nr:hypothetical protein PHYPA_013630 [Physcomitrium patens]
MMTGMAVRLLMWASIVGIGCDAISSRPAGALELRLLTESSSTVVGHSPSWPIHGMLTTRGWDVPRRGRGACSTGTHCFPAGPPLLLCRFERWVPGRLGSLN